MGRKKKSDAVEAVKETAPTPVKKERKKRTTKNTESITVVKKPEENKPKETELRFYDLDSLNMVKTELKSAGIGLKYDDMEFSIMIDVPNKQISVMLMPVGVTNTKKNVELKKESLTKVSLSPSEFVSMVKYVADNPAKGITGASKTLRDQLKVKEE